jgi:UDPglucose--hexose-1-phosphate uridylyltransferase
MKAHAVSVYTQMLKDELSDGSRILDQNDHVVAFVPFAAICPFETWILPRKHDAHFVDTTDQALRAFADVLHRHLTRLHRFLDEPPFNLVIRTAPVPNRARASAYN